MVYMYMYVAINADVVDNKCYRIARNFCGPKFCAHKQSINLCVGLVASAKLPALCTCTIDRKGGIGNGSGLE